MNFEQFTIREKTYIINFEQMKTIKPIITLICLITLLVFAIREKHTTEKIINNLLYQEERIQMKTKPHH